MANEINASVNGNAMYHTENKLSNGEIIYTGFYKKEINVGDIFYYHPSFKTEIVEVMERRNHAGIFINSDDKINSFFKIKVKQIK